MERADLGTALRERVVIVLVEPQYPGNVGAAARAMRNMGMERLVLVAPPAYDPEQARWMAPGCADILANARLVSSLDEALVGVHRVVATTARHRRGGPPVLEPRDVAARILDDDCVTAVLFGREDHGLPSTATSRATSLLRIPTSPHASLNLGQAVLLVCHNLFEEARHRGMSEEGRVLGGSRRSRSTRSAQRPDERAHRADVDVLEPVANDLVQLLVRVGYTRSVQPDRVRATAREVLQEARITIRHAEALRGMVRRVQWALDNPGCDWTRSASRNRRESGREEPPDTP